MSPYWRVIDAGHRHLRVLALPLVLLLVLAACASAQDPIAGEADDNRPTPQEPPTEVASDTVVGDTVVGDAAGDEVAGDEPAVEGTSEPSATIGDGNDTLARAHGCANEDPLPVGRTDVLPSGNRVAPGGIDLLSASMMTVDLPAPATWVVQASSPNASCEAHWYVTLADGQAVVVNAAGQVSDAGIAVTPPETSPAGITTAHWELDRFDDPLPDSRVVSSGRWSVALVDPTDRYGHGVLGDRIEAGAFEIVDAETSDRTRVVIEAPSVIEGISAILVDVDDDDQPEILVTQSNADVGAWLVLYNIDGTMRAQSDPIGRGNRWRNQLGAGFVGPNGEFEIVDIRTPHLDGVVEFFQVQGDRLEQVATTTGYTTHVIGSRNLDMGIMLDADADKRVEVVVPTRDLMSLTIIERVGADATEIGRIELNGKMSTNLATQWIAGHAWLALGTSDGRLLIWGDPS